LRFGSKVRGPAMRGLCPRTPRIFRFRAAGSPIAWWPRWLPRGLPAAQCGKSQGVWGTGPPELLLRGLPEHTTVGEDHGEVPGTRRGPVVKPRQCLRVGVFEDCLELEDQPGLFLGEVALVLTLEGQLALYEGARGTASNGDLAVRHRRRGEVCPGVSKTWGECLSRRRAWVNCFGLLERVIATGSQCG